MKRLILKKAVAPEAIELDSAGRIEKENGYFRVITDVKSMSIALRVCGSFKERALWLERPPKDYEWVLGVDETGDMLLVLGKVAK